jgi:two-component system, LytTR family, sensor kinase
MHNRLWLHICFWIVYVLEDTALEFAWIRASTPNLTEWERFVVALKADLLLLPPKLLFVYFILKVTIDRGILRNRNMYVLVLEMLGALFIAVVIHRAIVHFYIVKELYDDAWEDEAWLDPKRMLSAVLDIGFVAGGAVALKLLRMYFLSREKEKNLAREKLEAELKFLRAQTNPHFLFNTLNNIYALARKKSDETADVVMKLSKLLRFMLYESREDRITLAEELRIIEDYIELEKIRYGDRLKVQVQKNIDNSSQKIAPLLLLPFIENAFKHGASETRHQSFIDIAITLRDGNLFFSVQNSKDSDEQRELKENIGLGNVRRQLQLMYPVHSLDLKNENGYFLAKLNINLNKNALV